MSEDKEFHPPSCPASMGAPSSSPSSSMRQEQQQQQLEKKRLLTSPSSSHLQLGMGFPEKIRVMLDYCEDHGLDHIVSWALNGKAFKVHKPADFESRIMPSYFNQQKFKSFQRQLNSYGFDRIPGGSSKGCYLHKLFLRENSSLCKHISKKVVTRQPPQPEQPPRRMIAPTGTSTTRNFAPIGGSAFVAGRATGSLRAVSKELPGVSNTPMIPSILQTPACALYEAHSVPPSSMHTVDPEPSMDPSIGSHDTGNHVVRTHHQSNRGVTAQHTSQFDTFFQTSILEQEEPFFFEDATGDDLKEIESPIGMVGSPPDCAFGRMIDSALGKCQGNSYLQDEFPLPACWSRSVPPTTSQVSVTLFQAQTSITTRGTVAEQQGDHATSSSDTLSACSFANRIQHDMLGDSVEENTTSQDHISNCMISSLRHAFDDSGMSVAAPQPCLSSTNDWIRNEFSKAIF